MTDFHHGSSHSQEADQFAETLKQYILEFNKLTEPLYQEAEQYLAMGYEEIKENPVIGLGFLTILFLVVISIVTKFLGSLMRSEAKVVYFREESVTNADLKAHIDKFKEELAKFKSDIAKSGGGKAAEKQVSQNPGQVTYVDDKELLNKVANIQKSYDNNQNTLKKFITQKNKMSEFLTEFHEEVSESHKSIWKELNTLKTKFTFGRQSTTLATSGSKKLTTSSIDLQQPIKEAAEGEREHQETPQNNSSRKYEYPSSNNTTSSNQPNSTANATPQQQVSKTINNNNRPSPINTEEANIESAGNNTMNNPVRAGRVGRAGGHEGRGENKNEDGGDEALKREISPFRPIPDQTRILPKKMPVPGKKAPGVNPVKRPGGGANPFANNI